MQSSTTSDSTTNRPASTSAVAKSLSVTDQHPTTLTLRQSLLPVCLVTILSFMWGFAYGLLDVLNKHFQETLNVTMGQSSGLQGAYFGAYFFAPLTFSGYVLRRWGYKVTFMTGLSIYGVGALLYWPSVVYRSFAGFCAATFVIACGLSTLETAAHPYIAICGPPKYSEVRLNTSQAFQAIGSTVVAPLLADQVLFKHGGSDDLHSVQYVYLAIAIFVFLLAVAFYFAPIPEITDADMQSQMEETGIIDDDNIPIYKQRNLLFGTAAQFCYVGAQVAVATYFINYETEVKPDLSDAQASNYLQSAAVQACFAVGRFSAALAMIVGAKPRYILLFHLAMTVVFSACAQRQTGAAGIAILPPGYGDLLPQSGDENGEGIPPSQGNEPAVRCDLQPPMEGTLGNNLGIDSPKSTGVDTEHAVVFPEANTWLASLRSPMETSHLAHRHGHFMKMFEADEVIMSSLSVALTYVFDPGGLSCLHEDVLSACQPVSMTSNRRSTFAADHEHLLDVGGVATLMVKKHADTLVHAHIQVGQKKVPQDATALYDCALWLNVSNCKEGTDAYFLIPLRGSNSVQWNDEDFDEDVAALKMKTKRKVYIN